jgi:hypothetical protein
MTRLIGPNLEDKLAEDKKITEAQEEAFRTVEKMVLAEAEAPEQGLKEAVIAEVRKTPTDSWMLPKLETL